MHSNVALLALLPSALGAALSPRPMNILETREPTAQCNGNAKPNYDDCQAVLDANFDCTDAGRLLDQPGAGRVVYWQFGNCQVSAAFFDANYRISYQQVCAGVAQIQNLCAELDAGGSTSQNPESYSIEVANNPDFVPSKAKRQQDSDTSFDVAVQLNGVLQDDMRQEITRGTSGTSVTITEEQSVENSLTLSVSISAGLAGIVETSTGIDTTQSYTSSSSFGVSVPINCNSGQEGVIFFIPAFNIFRGTFQPSGDYLEIKQPATNPDGRTSGEYRVECQG